MSDVYRTAPTETYWAVETSCGLRTSATLVVETHLLRARDETHAIERSREMLTEAGHTNLGPSRATPVAMPSPEYLARLKELRR